MVNATDKASVHSQNRTEEMGKDYFEMHGGHCHIF